MRLLGLLGLLVCVAAGAQTYPNKPVRLIVTYPPGGSSDLMSRVYGAKLAELWKQQVIIESKPGAAGSIGKDFVAVSQISAGPNVLVVRADSPFKSLTSIIAYAQVNPGKLNYGTSGPGSVSHLSSEMLKNTRKITAVEVPYKGGVLAIQDLLGGQIDFIFSDSLPAMAHIRGGKLRPLCVTGTQKYELLPEPPTCQEAAAGLVAVNWWGVLYPAGTPKAIVDKLHRDTVKALADPEVKKKFADLGVEAKSSSPAEFSAFIKAEMAKYAKLVKEANIKVNP
jgi:tripartite-type tricarboxylate transporter receptor subunit TctC